MKAKKKSNTHKTAHDSPHLKLRKYYILLAACAVFGAVVLVIALQYRDKALPNTYVGNVAVGNLTAPQIKQVVQDEASQMQVTFKDGSTTLTAAAKDLGVNIDIDATVKQAMLARRSKDILGNIELWQNKKVPLVYGNDAGVLKTYIATHFPQAYVDPKDAQVTYNDQSHQFDVTPSATGHGFDIKRFEAALPGLASNPRLTVLPIQTVPVQPLIPDKAAGVARDEANKFIQLAIQFTENGKTVYQASPDEIASWAYFTPDPSAGKITVAFDRSHVVQFLSDQVAGKVTTLPVDRKVAIDATTGYQSVIQQGQPGHQLKEIDKLADAVMDALNNNKPLTQEVSVENAPFKTVTVSGDGKWIEVDLTHETTTLYIGNVPIQTFFISSGRAATPTQTGTFYVYRKLDLTTMTGTILGEYYYIPNIPWVSYFDGGEAFHGTYWHHNFGHPMSHGCINMSIPDAKILYDFAPVGTKVVVHN